MDFTCICLIKWVYLHTFKTGGLRSVVSGYTSYLIDHLMIPITLNVILMTSNNLCSYPMTSNHEMRCRMYFWNPSVCFERDLDCGIDYDNKNRFAHPQLKQVIFFKKKRWTIFPGRAVKVKIWGSISSNFVSNKIAVVARFISAARVLLGIQVLCPMLRGGF